MAVALHAAGDIGVQALDPVREAQPLQELQRAVDGRRLRGLAGLAEGGDQVVGLQRPVGLQQQLKHPATGAGHPLLGVAAALVRENLGTRIETAEDLARIAGVPSYGEVPHEPAVTRLATPEALALDNRLHVFAEALRDVRTNLLFTEGGKLRSVLITSPEGSHGKTTISYGLAVTLARAGTSTLLVDGDLRRGRISEMMNITRSPGLTEVLIGDSSLDDAIRKTSNPSLNVLTGGRRLADPGEMLTISFGSVLSQLAEMYETIVIDGTPLAPISDARVIARFADASVIVVSAGSATRRQLRTAIERLSVISVRPTAVVLNDAPIGDSSYYHMGPEKTSMPRRGRRSSERLASRR